MSEIVFKDTVYILISKIFLVKQNSEFDENFYGMCTFFFFFCCLEVGVFSTVYRNMPWKMR